MDREKVINGLKCLMTDSVPCNGCPYCGSGYCVKNIASDALDLLKEQEVVTVHDPGAFCPKCGWTLYPEDHPRFCGYCGMSVKWE